MITTPEITHELPIHEAPFRVTDLKQWVYCPRVLYYHVCLPDVRPVTYKMKAGIEAGIDEESREERRSLRVYGLKEGRREFNVSLLSERLGLRGCVDMVIWLESKNEVIPVDYKLSEISGPHFKMQLAAYGLMLEESYGYSARRGFLYSIPRRAAEEVKLNDHVRAQLTSTLEAMHAMIYREVMPEATPSRAKCVACEFRLFCNDIF